MKKRYVSIVLLVCLLIGVFAGCSGGDKAADKGKDDITSKTEKTTISDDPSIKMSDVPGMTAPGVLPIVTEPTTLTIGIPQHVMVMDYEDNYMTKLLLEETGIKAEFYLFPAQDAVQKFEMMVSANQELPDIIQLHFADAARANYGKNGVFIPLNEYFDKYAHFYNIAQVTKDEHELIKAFGTSPDGNIYAFPSYVNGYGDISMFSWFINMPWLDKVGYDIPTTTDELCNVLKAFKEKDPNDNGKPDEIPLISSSGWNGNVHWLLINSFIHYNPTYLFNVENGKLSVPVITDEYREALLYIRKLVREDLLSPLTFTITNAELKPMINLPAEEDTIVGMWCGSTVTLLDADNTKVFEYEGAPCVKGPKGVSWCPNRTPNYIYAAQITKYCKNPEVAFRMFDYWTETKRSLITRYGEPGVHWLYRDDDPETFDKMFPYPRYDLGYKPIYAQIPDVTTPWASENKAIWNQHFCCFLPTCVYNGSASDASPVTYYGEAQEKGLPVTNHRTYVSYKSYEDKAFNIPKETVTRLIYTEEEDETIKEIRSTIYEYIQESLALFCTDQLSIEKDWDRYLKDLKEMGLDLYLETAQKAYDRMFK